MKPSIYITTLLLIASIFTFSVSAQNEQTGGTTNQENTTANKPVAAPKPFPTDLNIQDQLNFALEKSSNYQDYKVIREAWMLKLKSNILDSITAIKTDLNNTKAVSEEKNKTIETLKTDLKNIETELNKKNSFSLLWIMVSKATYDKVMLTIIGILVIAIVALILAFKRTFAVTSQLKKDLNEVKDEYENYRKKALKSKEDAVRQLYDELSKYKNKK